MHLAIASDHGGIDLKTPLLTYVKSYFPDISVSDLGVSSSESVDYPDIADILCTSLLTGDVDLGVLICGTGIGISMRANRYSGIRAALVYDDFTAQMAKQHNNANVLCLGGRTTSPDLACNLLQRWLSEPFEGGRHQRRIDKLDTPIIL